MPEIERRRKKPLVVDVLLWDGTNYGQVRDFAGGDPEGGRNAMLLQSRELAVWNNQEQVWFDIPVGHYVVRGALGEMYGLSPEAYATTYEPAAETNGKPYGQVLHDSLQRSAGATFGLLVSDFVAWDQVPEWQRGRLESAADDLIAAYLAADDPEARERAEFLADAASLDRVGHPVAAAWCDLGDRCVNGPGAHYRRDDCKPAVVNCAGGGQ
jgi:hypothetical protein